MTDFSSLASRVEAADRIHIIGGPGAGKSTLAQRLGQALDLPVYPLDTFAYEGQDFVGRRVENSASDANSIAASPRWVTEGIFVGWTDPLLRRADVIVWLDCAGWRQAARRIIARFFRHGFGEMKARRGAARFLRFSDYIRHLRQLVFVLVASREYWQEPKRKRRYPVTRREVEQALMAHGDKVIRVTQASDARRLTESATSSPRRPPSAAQTAD